MRPDKPEAAIIGAGLVGSLLSIFLARRGHRVTVYERRRRHAPRKYRRRTVHQSGNLDPRASRAESGGTRGGGPETSDSHAGPHDAFAEGRIDVPTLRSRRLRNTSTRFRAADLNKTLMTAAEQTGRVKIEFDHAIDDPSVLDVPMVFGADGSGSAVRRALAANPRFHRTLKAISTMATRNSPSRRVPAARTELSVTHFTSGRAARIC